MWPSFSSNIRSHWLRSIRYGPKIFAVLFPDEPVSCPGSPGTSVSATTTLTSTRRTEVAATKTTGNGPSEAAASGVRLPTTTPFSSLATVRTARPAREASQPVTSAVSRIASNAFPDISIEAARRKTSTRALTRATGTSSCSGRDDKPKIRRIIQTEAEVTITNHRRLPFPPSRFEKRQEWVRIRQKNRRRSQKHRPTRCGCCPSTCFRRTGTKFWRLRTMTSTAKSR